MEKKIYICKVCRKPLADMEPKYQTMMEMMDMPLDGGAHEKCLFEKPTNTKPIKVGS